MADKVTTTKTTASSKKGEEADDKVQRLLEELKEAMMEAGKDEGTVDAILFAAQPDQINVVGNLADIQRMGALVSEGESGNVIEEAVVTHPEAKAEET